MLGPNLKADPYFGPGFNPFKASPALPYHGPGFGPQEHLRKYSLLSQRAKGIDISEGIATGGTPPKWNRAKTVEEAADFDPTEIAQPTIGGIYKPSPSKGEYPTNVVREQIEGRLDKFGERPNLVDEMTKE